MPILGIVDLDTRHDLSPVDVKSDVVTLVDVAGQLNQLFPIPNVVSHKPSTSGVAPTPHNFARSLIRNGISGWSPANARENNTVAYSIKPPWDTSKEGSHPAFAEPTKQEIEEARTLQREAREMADSPGRKEASDKQLWIANAELRERTARANLALVLPLKRPKEAFAYRYQLAIALKDLGRFAEAVALITTAKGKSLKGLAGLRREIEWWRLAVYRPDKWECNCTRKVETIDDPTRRGAPVEIVLKRRHSAGWVYSYRHGAVIEAWRCSLCGCGNAHGLGPPENQRAIHEARALIANPKIKLDDRQMARFSDQVILKKST